MSHPFDRLHAAAKADIITAVAAYETMLVRRACGVLGLKRRAAGLDTFAAFGEAFPAFPYRLACDRLDGVKLHTHPKAMLVALLRRFQAAPWMAPLRLHVESSDSTRRAALVVPRRGTRYGLVIYEGDAPGHGRGRGVLRWAPSDRSLPPICVEEFDAWLRALAVELDPSELE